MLDSKLRTGTSKAKRLHPVKFEFALFWMSQCVACSPVRCFFVPCDRQLQRAHYLLLNNIFVVFNFRARTVQKESKQKHQVKKEYNPFTIFMYIYALTIFKGLGISSSEWINNWNNSCPSCHQKLSFLASSKFSSFCAWGLNMLELILLGISQFG